MTRYQEIRAAGKAMHAKTLQATKLLDFDLGDIARRLKVPTNRRTLLFVGEAAQNACFDFWFVESRLHDQTLVGDVHPVAADLDGTSDT